MIGYQNMTMILLKGSNISTDGIRETKRARPNSQNNKTKDRGKRVPCPIDPSHFIFESAIAKHVLVCPAVRQKKEVTSKEYYCEGINLGGFGDLGRSADSAEGSGNSFVDSSDDAKKLALAILRVFHHVFLSSKISILDAKDKQCATTLSKQQLQNITEQEIYDALPEVDLSKVEEGASLADAINKCRIRAGGSRHQHQIASILGHIRQKGLMETKQSEAKDSLVIEMGAGRGITGLVVAGAMGASLGKHADINSSGKVKLCLVEKSGTRGKAENRVRAAERDKHSKDDCLRLDLVEVSRVKCDLAHVDMPKALTTCQMSPDSSKIVVVAKHLCGAGTDLALKSLRGIGSIDGCVMATCCHGLCTWSEYVGRNCLLALFRSEVVGELPNFGENEFNLLKRWTSASVLGAPIFDSIELDADNTTKEEHSHFDTTEEGNKGRYYSNILSVVKELGLTCGGNGLGRACQRLIDYGRRDYMMNNLFVTDDNSSNDNAYNVDLCHYVPRAITPQNALLVASKFSHPG